MKHLPMFDPKMIKILTVRQPWAHLIMIGKDIENRSWTTHYRGTLYIHAAGKMHGMPISQIERQFDLKIDPALLRMGVIIGRVELVDIVTRSDSPWFEGPFGWVLRNPEPINPIPLRGQMGLFEAPESLIL